MATFDFVSDDDLRASLEADASEMSACLAAQANKATVVLAGSIVEAVLLDHLLAAGYADPRGRPLDELALGELIDGARSSGALSKRVADLSSAVRDYRNLIHPGRVKRLGEAIDAGIAGIAVGVVDVVSSEVARLKRETYGYTAQQIVSKVESDSSSIAILGDLMLATKQKELERLMLVHIPQRYLELASAEDPDDDSIPSALARLRRAYRAAFDFAQPDVRARVMREYARVLREETSEFRVLTHEEAFFRADDMESMSKEDAAMAKAHLLSRVGRSLPAQLMESLDGIGKYANSDELSALVDIAVRSVVVKDQGARRMVVGRFLQQLYMDAPTDVDQAVPKQLGKWERTYQERTPDLAAWLAEQRAAMVRYEDLPDLPF